MTTRSTLTLRGQRNQCPGCGEMFNSNHAFEKHRVGDHVGNGRHCLTPREMLDKGMLQRGPWWVGSAREHAAVEEEPSP